MTTAGVAREPFEYAVVRVMPRIDRGEFVNAGVVVYCQNLDYLCALTSADEERWQALDGGLDVDGVRAALSAYADTCAGDSGPAGDEMSRGQRFRWLTAPRSTVVQTGPVHTGLTADPDVDLRRLFALLVG
ncbi:MAG: hypothetical protein QOF57_1098 [Frankiaceae bacterium]|jgi:hypothetical protein|nr:hypothetical protein [Frankiaceae bacterium]